MLTVLALLLPGLPLGFVLGILWVGYAIKQERNVRMLTCCCCGIALEFTDAEPVLVGMDGHDDVMCRRCFREDCDCLDEPMFALEPERPTDAEYVYFHGDDGDG